MATQDELIQAELDGTIEELEAKETQADGQEAEATTTQETVEQTTEEVKEEKVEGKSEVTSDTTTNKQSSVMKLLKQRNEARAEVERLQAQAKDTADLEARIKELEEGIASQELEREAAKEKEAFFEKYPSAK